MDEKHILDFEAVVFLDDGIGYASDFEKNGLYEVDLNNQKCKFIMLFPNETMTSRRIHCTALHHASKVFFVPMSGDYISIYDIGNNTIEQIAIPALGEKYSCYREKQKFSKAVCYEGNIYMFPFTYPGIIKLETETNQITILDDWVSNEQYFFRGGMCVDGEMAYLANGVNNIILQFNMETEKAVVYYVGAHNNGAMCISKYENYYWIVPRLRGAVICWNPVNNHVIYENTSYLNNFNIDKIVFSEIISYKGQMFFVPFNSNKYFSVDKETGNMIEHKKWKMSEGAITTCMFEAKNYYYFAEIVAGNKMVKRYKIGKLDGKTEKYEFIIENYEQYKKDVFHMLLSERNSINESELFGLSDFLRNV